MGGQVSPDDIAEAHDRHVDSVRSALRKMDDLVQREYGSVALRSTYVSELVHDAVQQAEEAVQDAMEAGAKALEAAERGLDERTSAFLAFCSKHDVDVTDRREARMRLRFGELDPEAEADPAYLVRQARDLWREARQDVERFRTATVVWDRPDGSTCRMDAWRLLA